MSWQSEVQIHRFTHMIHPTYDLHKCASFYEVQLEHNKDTTTPETVMTNPLCMPPFIFFVLIHITPLGLQMHRKMHLRLANSPQALGDKGCTCSVGMSPPLPYSLLSQLPVASKCKKMCPHKQYEQHTQAGTVHALGSFFLHFLTIPTPQLPNATQTQHGKWIGHHTCGSGHGAPQGCFHHHCHTGVW